MFFDSIEIEELILDALHPAVTPGEIRRRYIRDRARRIAAIRRRRRSARIRQAEIIAHYKRL